MLSFTGWEPFDFYLKKSVTKVIFILIFFGRSTTGKRWKRNSGFLNLLQVCHATLPCLTSNWARPPSHPQPSTLQRTLLPPWCLCHRSLAHRGFPPNKSSQHGTAYILRSATLASTCWKVSARLDQPLLHWLLTLAVRYVGGDDDNGDDCFDDDDAALAPQVTTSILSQIYQPGLVGTF